MGVDLKGMLTTVIGQAGVHLHIRTMATLPHTRRRADIEKGLTGRIMML